MDWIDVLLGFVREHETLILLAGYALILLLVISNLCLFAKMGKLARQLKTARPVSVESLPGNNEELIRRLGVSEEQLCLLAERQKELYSLQTSSVQRVGLVRFNAFPDVGGEQSFALALLNRNMSGMVLSSLYGRSDSRVYAKEVTEGRSQHALSDEEREAIRQAGVL